MKHYQTRVEGRASSAGQAKRYEPVREFKRATSYCPRKASNFAEASMDRSSRGGPLYLAWRILDEARDYRKQQ
jgi:hypothetical protein